MLPFRIDFITVFLLLALTLLSVSKATSSSVINPSSTIITASTATDIPSDQSISPNATTTTSTPSSTPNVGGSPSNDSSNGAPSGNPNTPSFTIPWHLFTLPPTTTTPPPTTIPTTPHPCVFAKKPTNIDECGNETCALSILNDIQFYISCDKIGNEKYYEHPTSLADMGEKLAQRISDDIENKLEAQKPVNTTVVIVTNQLAIGASTIDSSMYLNISRGMFAFPNISIQGTKEKLGKRSQNSLLYPKKDLPKRSGRVKVAWSISESWKTAVPEEEMEPFRDIVWRLPVSDMRIEKNKILVHKEKPALTINSPVITFSMDPKPVTPLENPFLIEFRRMKSDGAKNHRCYYWSDSSTSGFWSSIGSSVVSNNDTHTVCSYNHMSTFVVLSEVHLEPDNDARNAVRIVAIVFCVFAMVALIATLRMTKQLGCMENDRVIIHIHLCIVLLIGYFLFIIGAIKSDIEILQDILVVGLHFCQLAPFVWLCLEAVYFINTVFPIFNYENTDTQKFYTSLGWAITAAFAFATAGYDRPHSGKPLGSEIVWVFIDKVTCRYFFGPFLALFMVNIFVRIGLVIHVSIHPQENESNKAPMRIKVNLLTTLVLTAVVFLAWYFGVQAVNNTETKGYHYGFILLYFFQAVLVFVIYGWKNEEMWSLYNKKDEERKEEEGRKITFTYVP